MKEACIKERGYSVPLGATSKEKGVNFALFSEHASRVILCLFTPNSKDPFIEIPLDPQVNKTGFVWHILLKALPEGPLEYGYRVDGPVTPLNPFNPKHILHDPYARGLNTSHEWGIKGKQLPRGKIFLDSPFDWQGTSPPKIPLEDLIIYEMHVRAFTRDPSSKTKHPGTFLGIVEKIPYLKNLGVNAIELMPIFEFDECENTHRNPKTKELLKNMWGYSTINFFTPMNRYASSPEWLSAMNDLRTLIREMHKNGMEVYLDVVYNHTAEGVPTPTYSFRGIDNQTYYMLNPDGSYLNYSGTGNTISANHPFVAKFILDSLHYWVNEMHVDGFRFDLASSLTRDCHGVPLSNPPVIEAITLDSVLANVKLIAEAWDAGGLYQVGSFPGNPDEEKPRLDAKSRQRMKNRWMEWNGKYRDVVRRFIKGTENQVGHFATVMSGSEDIYGVDRNPWHSINFVTAHDGFTLRDLVSYQGKHNEANGENNRDGCDQNDSWNCGTEGPTKDPKILKVRERQMRNFQVALLVGLGTPMLLMGDEYGHTRNGNNNGYCQDNALNWFLWDHLANDQGFVRFHRLMVHFRKQCPLLRRKDFLSKSEIDWHGHLPLHPDWSPHSRFIAYTLKDHNSHPLYIAFNAHFQSAHIQLPPPPTGKKWCRIVDTSLDSPDDYNENPQAHPLVKLAYDMPEYSAFIAQAF